MFKFYYTASIVKDANSPDNYDLHFPQSWSCNCDIILLLISLDHNPTCKLMYVVHNVIFEEEAG